MSRSVSARKKRQIHRYPPEELIIEKVRELLANKPGVVSMESHFAGYFNELGFFIYVDDLMSREEILGLGDELLFFLQTYFAEHSLAFSWQVGIYRQEELIHVLPP
ncbi:MAG: hypothetical protein K1X48_03905 [Burkholderiaceae bacterium]|nr:hypothetical protein [Burkholderiaceae bacterium]